MEMSMQLFHLEINQKDTFVILSLEDNNQISISGNDIETLEKGEYVDVEVAEPSIISSSEGLLRCTIFVFI